MKILLCSQYLGKCEPVAPPKISFPLGLAYIASSLAEHEVHIFDANVENDPLRALSKAVEKLNPDLVGVSLRNIDGQLSFNECSHYEPFVSMIRTIKSTAPSTKLVIGGAGFTIFPEEIMKQNPEIDFGVVSHGETAIADLVKDLDHPDRVRNIVFRVGQKIHFTGIGEPPNLDALPSFSVEGFDMAKYKQFPFSVGIDSRRGCAFKCVYCLYSHLHGYRVLFRSPKVVVDDIEKLVDNYGIRHFFFADPIFNFPFTYGRRICEEITRRNLDIRWRAWFRPDFMNARFMVEALRSGCDLFDFSPDGASNEAMKVLGKDMEVRDIEKTAELVGKTENANVGYNFMYDLPGANIQQLLGLTRLIPKIALTCKSKLQFLTLTRIRVYPHTVMYNIALKEGKINEKTDLILPMYYKSDSSILHRYHASLIGKLNNVLGTYFRIGRRLSAKTE